MPRINRRHGLLLVFIVLIVIIYSRVNLHLVSIDLASETPPSPNSIRNQLDHKAYVHRDLPGFTQYYKDHRKDVEGDSIENRCRVFLRYFQDKHPEWQYSNEITSGYKRGMSEPHVWDDISHRMTGTFEEKQQSFAYQIKTNMAIESSFADAMAYLRIYSKCYFEEGVDNYSALSKKMFPFLSGKLPSGEPDADVINHLRTSYEGKGIVIAASSQHRQEVARLIRLLRALNNELPIEIVHRGDIDSRTEDVIVTTATASVETLLSDQGLVKTNNLNFRPDIHLLKHHTKYGSTFPKQKVTFVNVESSISPRYLASFNGYGMKSLALLLSSFKEAILMDADVAPLVTPEELFHSRQYQSSGTYFFRDRSIMDTNTWDETNFFAKLMPQGRLDELFGYSPISEKTLGNRYMSGWRHMQEAGVVVINKRQHFAGIAAMTQLIVCGDPISSMVWGDKELYWLGMAIAGDENYSFSEYSAAAVGSITSNHHHQFYNADIQELCSSHPGHVDSTGKVLWLNSGFQWCKMNMYSPDIRRFPYKLMEYKDVVGLYSAALSINAVMIPPEYEAPSGDIKFDYKDLPDVDDLTDNPDYEPFHRMPYKGWNQHRICSGYHFCAYDQIDPRWVTQVSKPAVVFQYSAEQTDYYAYLAKVWYTGMQSFSKERVESMDPQKGKLPDLEVQENKPPSRPHGDDTNPDALGISEEQKEQLDRLFANMKHTPKRPNPGMMPEDEKVKQQQFDDMSLEHWDKEE